MTRRLLRSAVCTATLTALLAACSSPGQRWPWSGDPPPVAVPRGTPLAGPTGEPERAPPVPRPKPPVVAHAVPRSAPDHPVVTPKLVGLSEAETVQLLGPPTEQAEQAPGKVWTYRAGGCALSVHLFPDMDAGGFYALDYTADGDATAEACLRRAAEAHRKGEAEGS